MSIFDEFLDAAKHIEAKYIRDPLDLTKYRPFIAEYNALITKYKGRLKDSDSVTSIATLYTQILSKDTGALTSGRLEEANQLIQILGAAHSQFAQYEKDRKAEMAGQPRGVHFLEPQDEGDDKPSSSELLDQLADDLQYFSSFLTRDASNIPDAEMQAYLDRLYQAKLLLARTYAKPGESDAEVPDDFKDANASIADYASHLKVKDKDEAVWQQCHLLDMIAKLHVYSSSSEQAMTYRVKYLNYITGLYTTALECTTKCEFPAVQNKALFDHYTHIIDELLAKLSKYTEDCEDRQGIVVQLDLLVNNCWRIHGHIALHYSDKSNPWHTYTTMGEKFAAIKQAKQLPVVAVEPVAESATLASSTLSSDTLVHDFTRYISYLTTVLADSVDLSPDSVGRQTFLDEMRQAKLVLLHTFVDAKIEWGTIPEEFTKFKNPGALIRQFAEQLPIPDEIRGQVFSQCEQIDVSTHLCMYPFIAPKADSDEISLLYDRLRMVTQLHNQFIRHIESPFCEALSTVLSDELLKHCKELADDMLDTLISLDPEGKEFTGLLRQLQRVQEQCEFICKTISKHFPDSERDWSTFLHDGEYYTKIASNGRVSLGRTDGPVATLVGGLSHSTSASLSATTSTTSPPAPIRPSIQPPEPFVGIPGTMSDYYDVVKNIVSGAASAKPFTTSVSADIRDIKQIDATSCLVTMHVYDVRKSSKVCDNVLVSEQSSGLRFRSQSGNHTATVSAAISGALLLAHKTPDEPPIVNLCSKECQGYDDLIKELATRLSSRFVDSLFADPPSISTIQLDGRDHAQITRVEQMRDTMICLNLHDYLTHPYYDGSDFRGDLIANLRLSGLDIDEIIRTTAGLTEIEDKVRALMPLVQKIRQSTALQTDMQVLRSESPPTRLSAEP